MSFSTLIRCASSRVLAGFTRSFLRPAAQHDPNEVSWIASVAAIHTEDNSERAPCMEELIRSGPDDPESKWLTRATRSISLLGEKASVQRAEHARLLVGHLVSKNRHVGKALPDEPLFDNCLCSTEMFLDLIKPPGPPIPDEACGPICPEFKLCWRIVITANRLYTVPRFQNTRYRTIRPCLFLRRNGFDIRTDARLKVTAMQCHRSAWTDTTVEIHRGGSYTLSPHSRRGRALQLTRVRDPHAARRRYGSSAKMANLEHSPPPWLHLSSRYGAAAIAMNY
jgi:hypothetical protein